MIWCVEDDASMRDIEVYALQLTGIEARGFDVLGGFKRRREAGACGYRCYAAR